MRLFSGISVGDLRNIKYVLTDIDDTLTQDGRLHADAYDALWRLHDAGIILVPITGRPAGWCDLIAREWPVDGVVGENGAFAFWVDGDGTLKQFFHPNALLPENGGPIDRARAACIKEVPGARIARDQRYRLFDLAVDFAEEPPRLGLDAALAIKAICEREGLRAKVSSIHVNAWLGGYDKLSMTEIFLSKCFGYDPARDASKVLFFGDSPNDAPMFRHFPNSCGVANLGRYLDIMDALPPFVTSASFGSGFAEGANVLLQALEKR